MDEEGRPFEDKGERGNDKSGNNMTVDSKNVMAHAMFQRNHGDYVHPCIPKLQGDHS